MARFARAALFSAVASAASVCDQAWVKNLQKAVVADSTELCDDFVYTPFSEEARNPIFSAYTLEQKKEVKDKGGRMGFHVDKRIPSEKQTVPKSEVYAVRNQKVHAKWTAERFDRGHLCPSLAMSFKPDAHLNTFRSTNIAPQAHAFNEQAWKNLEGAVVKYVRAEGDLKAVTGLAYAFDDLLEVDGTWVPSHYWKVVATPQGACEAYAGENKDAPKTTLESMGPMSIDQLFKTVDGLSDWVSAAQLKKALGCKGSAMVGINNYFPESHKVEVVA